MDSNSTDSNSTFESIEEEDFDLLEVACNYLLDKVYPPNVDKNRKRVIRRKADTLQLIEGEVYQRKKKKTRKAVSTIACVLSIFINNYSFHYR